MFTYFADVSNKLVPIIKVKVTKYIQRGISARADINSVQYKQKHSRLSIV